MSNSTWCDLNKDCNILRLRDKCPNPKSGCQKIITYTPRQYMLEGRSIRNML